MRRASAVRAARPRCGARAAAVLTLAVSAVLAARAAADEPRPRRAVQVVVVGGADEAGPLTDAIRELLARLRITTFDTDEPPADAVLARVRVDLTRPGEATLLVSDGQTGEVVEQRAVPRDASPAIVREEIAHATQSAVESELLAEQDRAARKEPPAPAPPPPSPPPATPAPKEQPIARAPAGSPIALDLATLAGAGPFGGGSGAVVRVGGGAAVAWRQGLRPSLRATLTYALPFDASSTLVDTRGELASARALASVEVARASWIALDVGAGGGFDVLSVEPRSAVLPRSSLGDSTTRTDLVFSGSIAAHLAVAEGVVLTLDALVDADLAARRYVLVDGGTNESVLAPWRVRPTLLAGFTFTALGEGLFPRARGAQ